MLNKCLTVCMLNWKSFGGQTSKKVRWRLNVSLETCLCVLKYFTSLFCFKLIWEVLNTYMIVFIMEMFEYKFPRAHQGPQEGPQTLPRHCLGNVKRRPRATLSRQGDAPSMGRRCSIVILGKFQSNWQPSDTNDGCQYPSMSLLGVIGGVVAAFTQLPGAMFH